MNRRLMTLGILVATVALSACNAVGDDRNVVATVDGHELTASELNVLTEGRTDGGSVRSALTAWTLIAAVSPEMVTMRSVADLNAARDLALDDAMSQVGDAPRTDYELGLGGSSYLCVAAIPLDPTNPGADVIAEIKAGLSFADAAAQYSIVEALKSRGGQLSDQEGNNCIDKATFESAFPDVLALLNDAQATVGNPALIANETGDLLLLLRPYDELTADEQQMLAQVELSNVLSADLDEANVTINPRYGKWDATTREVVATSAE